MPPATDLAYGNIRIPFPPELRNRARLLSFKQLSSTSSPENIIENAFTRPIDGLPLKSILSPGDSVAIVIPDITRYAGTDRYLPLLLKKLNEGGVRNGDISLFVALGIHRKMEDNELSVITGGLSEEVVVIQNDPDAGLTYLGDTRRKTPVYINRELLGRDRIVTTGSISFHYFAGFGGGRKLIVPGMAGRETCYGTHFKIFAPEGGKDKRAAAGILQGNPVHEDMLEAAMMLKVDYNLSTCLSPDGEIIYASGGSLKVSHEDACTAYSECYSGMIENRLPLVIASAGGYPKDINFIQSHKALDSAFNALSPGGTIIMLAECREGLGHADFAPWFRYEEMVEFEHALRKDYVIYGQTAFATRWKTQQANVILVSSLCDHEVKMMGMTPAHTLEEALEKSALAHRDEIPFYLIPEAGYILPVVKKKMSNERDNAEFRFWNGE